MNILFLASRLPFPPNRGDRLRAFHVLRTLKEEGHNIHLASFISDKTDQDSIDNLRAYCTDFTFVPLPPYRSLVSCARALFGREPLQVAYYRSPGMTRRVRGLLERQDFDLAYVHLFRMAQYVPLHRNIYKVIDFTDVISREIERSLAYRRGMSRFIYANELPRIRAFETKVARSFDECWVVSEAERDVLLGLAPSARVHVIPNGVDLDQLKPLGCPPENMVTFVGHLNVPHNVDAVHYFYRDIFPLVRRHRPDCRFQVIGPMPHRSLAFLRDCADATLPGFVEDLNGALNRSTVFVAPIRYCAGLQNKVLEAMAAGTPVVATPCVNEGLGARDGEEILFASTTSDFAGKVVQLFSDSGLRQRLSLNGRRFVERRFSWRFAASRISQVGSELKAS